MKKPEAKRLPHKPVMCIPRSPRFLVAPTRASARRLAIDLEKPHIYRATNGLWYVRHVRAPWPFTRARVLNYRAHLFAYDRNLYTE